MRLLWPINDITTDNTGFSVTKNGNFLYDPLLVDSIKAIAGGVSFRARCLGLIYH